MDETTNFRRLLTRSALAVAVAAGLVAICYFFVDRPVAFYVHDHGLPKIEVLRWLTLPEPIFQTWAPLFIALLMVRRAWGPFARWERVVLAICVSVIIADQFRQSLKTPFGRLWPDTWIDNNPSLIKNDQYGFFPFHTGVWYASFPSGHTARALAFFSVLWIAYPKFRWLWALFSVTFGAALVGMNYHFVGDVIAGGFIGGIVGAYTARFCEVQR